MSKTKEPDPEALAALMRLEAKQVLRGGRSSFFPAMTQAEAAKIRSVTLEELAEAIRKSQKRP